MSWAWGPLLPGGAELLSGYTPGPVALDAAVNASTSFSADLTVSAAAGLVATYTDSASLLSDGSGSFAAPPYYNGAFSTGSIQFTHNGGEIERSGAGWGSCAWGTQYGPDSIIEIKIGTVGEFEIELRGKDMSSSNWDAYGLYYDNAGGWELYRTINATATTLASASGVTLNVGDVLGFVAIGSGSDVEIAGAIDTGSGFGADFITTTDSTSLRLTNSGYIGIWANGTTFGADELYGGTAVASSGGGTVAMSAAVNAVSEFAASQMIATRGLAATINAVSSFAATTLTRDVQLAAAVAAVSTFSGSVVNARQLAAAIEAVTQVSGDLSVVQSVPLAAVVEAVTAFTASEMRAGRNLAATVAAATGVAASGMVAVRQVAGAVSAATGVAASGMVAGRGIGGEVNATTSVSADLSVAAAGTATLLEAAVAASTALGASRLNAIRALQASIDAQSSLAASGMVATYRLSATVAAVSEMIASTLRVVGAGDLVLTPVADGSLTLVPVSDPGGLALAAHAGGGGVSLSPVSDPGGLTLTPYSDPGGLTLTPIT